MDKFEKLKKILQKKEYELYKQCSSNSSTPGTIDYFINKIDSARHCAYLEILSYMAEIEKEDKND